MTDLPSALPETQSELSAVYRLYSALCAPAFHPDHGLGGSMLYTGDLTPEASRLVRAANIAGAASLAAIPEPAQGREALREGVVDFLVTTLEEALRILKNEIRKRQPVAVAVAVSAGSLTASMLERGVLPDLLAAGASETAPFLPHGSRTVEPLPPAGISLAAFPLPQGPLEVVTAFELALAAALDPVAGPAHRWLHLSPRYLPRNLRRFRSIPLGPEALSALRQKLAAFGAVQL